MPKLTTYVAPTTNFANEDRNVEWLKPADLAKDATHFCIERISESKTADSWGNFCWYLQIVLPDHPVDTTYMIKLTKNGGKRDESMNMLRAELLKAQEANSDDRFIHNCMFVALPPQKKGQKPYMHLTSHDEECACGFVKTDEEHPF